MVEIGIVRSRWLTLACRILRRCRSEQKPSTAFVTLTKFCVQVYSPSYFQIKSKHKLNDVPKNWFDYKRFQNFPNLKVRNKALKVIKRTTYFAHPENIL